MERHAFEQGWAHDPGYRRPGRLRTQPDTGARAPGSAELLGRNGYIETAAQLVAKSRRGRRTATFHLRSRGMKLLKDAGSATEEGEGGRGADLVDSWRAEGRPHGSAAAITRSKDRLTSAANTRAAGVAVIRLPVRTKRRWPSQASSAATLPADSAVGQPEFHSGCSITSRRCAKR